VLFSSLTLRGVLPYHALSARGNASGYDFIGIRQIEYIRRTASVRDVLRSGGILALE
jgi:hypothetical protein